MSDYGSLNYNSNMGKGRQQTKGGFLTSLIVGRKNQNDTLESQWHNMTKEQQKRKIRYLWTKAKRYSNKIRL